MRLFVDRKTNRIHHDCRGHNIGRSMSLVKINCTTSFRAPKNIVLDTKIIILSGLFETNDHKRISNHNKEERKKTHIYCVTLFSEVNGGNSAEGTNTHKKDWSLKKNSTKAINEHTPMLQTTSQVRTIEQQ